jgi:hypothetical protein
MDKTDFMLLTIFGLALYGGLYGSYCLGHYHERRDLTMALVAQITDIRQDGYEEGIKTCRELH